MADERCINAGLASLCALPKSPSFNGVIILPNTLLETGTAESERTPCPSTLRLDKISINCLLISEPFQLPKKFSFAQIITPVAWQGEMGTTHGKLSGNAEITIVI
jgi:hypothetical protein